MDEPTDAVRSRSAFVFTTTVLLATLVTTMVAQLPVPLGALRRESRTFQAIWPQGWTFFSDAATVPVLVAYLPGVPPLELTERQMSAAAHWGLNRVAYAQILESRQLAAQVPDGGWQECAAGTRDACLSLNLDATWYRVANRFTRPTLCGRLLLAYERPQPWQADQSPDVVPRRIERTAAVQVRCVSG